jgi:predicted acetyltransferase
MALLVRPYQEADADAFFSIRSATYGNGKPEPPEQQVITLGRGIVCELDGQVAGIAKVNRYVASRDSASLRNAGIAAVAVSPSARRAGVGTALLAGIVRDCREEGYHVTSLHAFRESFYRKFGYEVCGRRIHIVCPTPRLPKLKTELPVRRLQPEEWELIRPCYESFAHSRSGLHIRDERRWNEVVTASDFPAVYAFGDPIESYVIVAHKVDFWVSQKVAEVAWSTEAGHRAIVAWFSGLGENKTHIDWTEPSDSPFVAKYLDQGIEVKVDRPIMYRVVDFKEAMRQLKPSDSGEFTIEIQDELLPENRGPWKVSFSLDGVDVERCDHAELLMDIRQFSCAFMGEPSLLDLARNGLLEVRDRTTLRTASRLFTPSPVCSWDFF